MKKSILLAAAALSTAMAMAPASAAALTGTYSTGGSTTGTGPWTMTSTNSTYSLLNFNLSAPVLFQNLADVSVDYISNLGGIGAGTPRLSVQFDLDNNLTPDAELLVNWGPAGSFADPTTGVAANTGNLIAMTDVGRYDLSGIGGSFYTDRAAALALAGNFSVVKLQIIVDSYNADRNFTINGFSAASVGGAVPEPASWAMMIGGFALVGASLRARRQNLSFA